MRSFVVVFFTLLFSSSLFAQENSPFGVRVYKFLGTMPSKNISFGAAKNKSNRKGKPMLYIDAAYKNLINVKEPKETFGFDKMFLHTGLQANIHIPVKRFSVSIGGTYYMPFKEGYSLPIINQDLKEITETSHSLYSINIEKNYFFTLGKKLMYSKIGTEIIAHNNGSEIEANSFGSIGLGMHFYKAWYCEAIYLTNLSSDNELKRQALTLAIGRRLFFKW